MFENKLIGEVEVGFETKVRVNLTKRVNSAKDWFCDTRLHVETEKGLVPTPKGLRLHPETLAGLIPLLVKAQRKLDGSIEDIKCEDSPQCPRCGAKKGLIHMFTQVNLRSGAFWLSRCMKCAKEFLV